MVVAGKRVRHKPSAILTQKGARAKYGLKKSFFVYWDHVFTRIKPAPNQDKRCRYYYEDEVTHLMRNLGRKLPEYEMTP